MEKEGLLKGVATSIKLYKKSGESNILDEHSAILTPLLYSIVRGSQIQSQYQNHSMIKMWGGKGGKWGAFHDNMSYGFA